MHQYSRRLLAGLLLLSLALPGILAASTDRNACALTGGRVIVAPGRTIEAGVVCSRRASSTAKRGRVGSLEAGKDATFILTDGDILDLRPHVVAAYVDGRALDLTDKQKRLYEIYRNRPKPVPSAPPSHGGGEGRGGGAK